MAATGVCFQPAMGDAQNPVVVTRSACIGAPEPCTARYSYKDFERYARMSETHPNNIPSIAYLKKDILIGTSDLRHRDLLNFNTRGELIGFWSRYRRPINGINVFNKTDYEVHPSGSLVSVTLWTGQLIGDRFFPADTTINLDDKGRVTSDNFYSTSAESTSSNTATSRSSHYIGVPTTLGETVLPAGTSVELDANGRIKRVSFDVGRWSDGKYFADRTILDIDSNGRLSYDHFYRELAQKQESGALTNHSFYLLNEPVTIGSITLPTGTLVEENMQRIHQVHLLESTNVCGESLKTESLFLTHYNGGKSTITLT